MRWACAPRWSVAEAAARTRYTITNKRYGDYYDEKDGGARLEEMDDGSELISIE